MEEDIKEIKEIVKTHDKDIKEIKETLKGHGEILKSHDKDIKEIKEILKSHDKDLKELKEMVISLQEAMVVIEDAVTRKIPAIFDGYKMHQEKQEQFEKRLDNLEEESEKHSIQIFALETVSKENSDNIAHLLS